MMTKSIRASLVLSSLVGVLTTTAAAGASLPGDNGRPGTGIMPAPGPAAPSAQPARPPEVAERAPDIGLAVKLAESVVQECRQFHLGVTVVNSVGAPVLVYVPNGSTTGHGYMALRKAYTAITFKTDTSALVSKGQQDTEFAARVTSDPNLVAYSGGVLLKLNDEIIGAVGVSGAEPGHHDEECALKGLSHLKGQLK